MADNTTHVIRDASADNTGMSAFMIIVLFVALLALGTFVYYAVNGGIPGAQQAVPDNDLDVGVQGQLEMPAPTNNQAPTAP